jgi:hypothetical protein
LKEIQVTFSFKKTFDLLKGLYNIFNILLEPSRDSGANFPSGKIPRLDTVTIKAGFYFSQKPKGVHLKVAQ